MDKKYCPYCMSPVEEGETCRNCGLTEGVYTPRDHHLPLGTVLNNRYLVGRVLGEGGFGITYIGCDLNLEMKVAVKEYFPIDRVYRFSKTSLQVSNYAHATEKYHSGKVKFLREARTMARLDKQQNIVSVRDFFEENRTAYIVMEYVEGTTLKELVYQRGGRIPAGELMHMLEPLFTALTSIHELGLIHRDISPDNLMLENGKIKLLDFGCARESAAQSETMTIALKQGYAPIEQYQHKGQGPWTDVYALSATIYYCLTGKTPQPAVDRLSEEELVPPRKLGVDLTASQETALLHGMNVKAKDRFQSAEELYAALYMNVKVMPASNEPVSVSASGEPIPVPVSDESISMSDSDMNQSVQNVQNMQNDNAPVDDPSDNKTVTWNSAEESLLSGRKDEEVTNPAEGGIRKVFDMLKQRRNLMILAGSVVLLVTVICIVCVVYFRGDSRDTIKKTNADVTDASGEGGTSGMVSHSGNQSEIEPSVDTPQEPETAEALFANAAVLESYTQEAIQRLMDDDTVSAIRIPEVASIGEEEWDTEVESTGAITITKPVLVDENTYISFHDMVTLMGENACLWIKGKIHVGGILQTIDGGRIVVENTDFAYIQTLWLEKRTDVGVLNGKDYLYGEYPAYDDLIIWGRNTSFRDAVPVSDEASLRQAVNDHAGEVIICGDITIETELNFARIMIEEGVTVTMQGSGSIIGNGGDCVLWNEGKIQGGSLGMLNSGVIINYGEIIDGDLIMRDSILVNLGNIKIDDLQDHSTDQNNCIWNMGTLRFQGKETMMTYSDLINYGTVSLSNSTQKRPFSFCCPSGIANYGEICVEDGYVILQSYLHNMIDGQITICDNAILENNGVIELSAPYSECELWWESQGNLKNENGAVFYSNGTKETLEYIPESGWFHIKNLHMLYEVTNIDELVDALQNPEVYGVNLTGEISWNGAETLTLTKDVVIAESAGFLMEDGSELILDSCILENHGYLKVDDLTLTHGGLLHNCDVGIVDLYARESAIKLGNVQGEKRYNETDCLLNEGNIRNGCEIGLYDSALMIQRGLLEGNMIQIRDHAYFANMGEVQWIDGSSIEISGKGRFHNLLGQKWYQELTIHIADGGVFNNYDSLVIQSGDISVEQGGSFVSSLARTTFGNNLSVSNFGLFDFCMGGDSSLLQGYFENHGVLQISGPSGFVIDAPFNANPACLDNQGEVFIADPGGYIRNDNGEFIGNAAIYRMME